MFYGFYKEKLMTSTAVLQQPFALKSLKLKNRIVMAPMTRNFAQEGIPNEANAQYYKKRASGDVGLILSEGTVVNRPAARNEAGIPFFYGEKALAGWKNVIDEVHEAGGKMGPQIWHTGSTRSSKWTPGEEYIESPSGLIGPNNPRGKAMSDEDIADTIAAFAQSAKYAKDLGFDTFEIHGAHGYLIDQFFWKETNLRDDKFGGKTIKERNRFAIEVIKAARAAVGADYPIIIRLSQWKQQDYNARIATTPDEMTEWLVPIVEAGADILHCSQRRFWQAEFPEIDGEKGLNFAGWAKKLTGAATISVGSVGLNGEFISAFAGQGSKAEGLDELLRRMENEEFDLIAVGRALLNDANWAQKVFNGDTASIKDFDPSALKTLD